MAPNSGNLQLKNCEFCGEPDCPNYKDGGSDSELLAAAKTFFAGGDTYALEGDTYAEHIEFFLTPNYVPVSIPMPDEW